MTDVNFIEPAMFTAAFAGRRRESHKGTYGHVAVFAGSGGHLGAGYLASMAALRAGCGLCTYCMPAAAFEKFDARYPEIMCDPIPDGGSGSFVPDGLRRAIEICAGKGAVAIGPAIGTSEGTREFVDAMVRKVDAPLVIDADGLNVLDLKALGARGPATVLTPHPGEMSRLMGAAVEEVQADRVGVARKLSCETGAVVVLKGSGTVVADPDGRAAINPTGNPGMATAGMGDALTGMIASFMAQGMGAHRASLAAVYLHGAAGDMAALDMGQASVVATDVIARVGRAMETI